MFAIRPVASNFVETFKTIRDLGATQGPSLKPEYFDEKDRSNHEGTLYAQT